MPHLGLSKVYEARGAAAILFRWARGTELPPEESMIVGPAGTGKSLGVGKFLWACADRWPDFCALVLRKTRVSLNDSFLDTFENEVLYPEHESVIGRTRENRKVYRHPSGGQIRLGGMDQGRRLFSTQYHVIFVEEMTELTEDEWQSLHRGLRRPGGPGWHLLLGAANPDAEWHWANRRFPDPAKYGKRRLSREGRERILSFHRDNPMLVGPSSTPEGRAYLHRLDKQLIGHMRDRLFLGLWRTASGLIYPMWDQFVHIQTGRLVWQRDAWGKPARGVGATLELPDLGFETDLTWFSGSQDFGWTSAGCQQVWGHDAEGREYRVAEVYQTHKDVEWWADWAADLWAEFRMRWLVCDNDEEKVKRMNDHLADRGAPRIARCVEKPPHKEVMFNAVREQMKRRLTDGYPGLYLIRNALRGGRDEQLNADKLPCCTEEEITGLVVRNPRETERGLVPYEESDPACKDHGCDSMGYEVLTAWKKDLTPKPKAPRAVQATSEAIKESAADLARRDRYSRRRGL